MAYLKNETPVTPAEALFLWKTQQLAGTNIAHNGSIVTSANGSVYAQSGDVIRTAADLVTPGAWYVHRFLPCIDTGVSYTTELCIQHDGAGGLRAKVSFRSGFSGGTPNITRTPSAADEQYILGGGTDASPTYTPFLQAPGFRMQGVFSESDETQFVMFYPVGGGACAALWMIDRPQPNPLGAGGDLLDKERMTFYAATGANCALALSVARESTAPRSLFNLGQPEQLWGRVAACMEWTYDSAGSPVRSMPGGCATSTLYAEPTVPEMALRYRRRAALAGTVLPGEVGEANMVDDKGTSVWFRFGGQTKASPVLLDSVNPSTGCVETGATLAIGDLLFPWDGTALVV